MSKVSKIVIVVVHGQYCVVNEMWLYKPHLKTETYSRSLKYCVLLHFNFRWTNPDSVDGLSERKKMIRAEKKSFKLEKK